MSTSSRPPTRREDTVVRVLALVAAALLMTGGLASDGSPETVAVDGITVLAEAARDLGAPVRSEGGPVRSEGGPSYDVAPGITLEARPTAHEATGRPVHIDIPALDVSAPVVPVSATGGELVPPADPQQLGWWAAGAKPGALTGTALMSGHTVSTGGGALDLLHELTPADLLTVRTTKGRIPYEVVRVAVYTRPALARASRRVFSQDGPGRLVLVTCTGYDGVEYLSNTVVVAVPVDGPAR